MIVFGVCVGDREKYETVALPSIRRVAAADDLILGAPGDPGICAVYNTFVAEARRHPDCDALVLLHEDLELVDPNFRAKTLRVLAEPSVGVAGVIGGAGLRDLRWWEARRTAGFVYETRFPVSHGAREADVDALDGMLLLISPAAFRTLEFDEVTYRRWNGYGFDYCLQARKAGMRVVVTDIDVLHRAKMAPADTKGWQDARAATRRKWPEYVRYSLPVPMRVRGAARALRARAWRPFSALGIRGLRARKLPRQPATDAQTLAARLTQTRLQFLGRCLPGGAILEVGGREFASAAKTAGYETYSTGSDSIDSWTAGRPGMRVDALLLWSGFERMADPPGFLATALEVLHPGGKIVMETPGGEGAAEDLRRLLLEAGFSIDCLLPVASHVYQTIEERRWDRNFALLERRPWPVLDSLLVVATAGTAGRAAGDEA